MKARHLLVGQGGEVLDGRNLGLAGQELVEMSSPAGGVLALPQPDRPGSVQYLLDATADAAGGLGLGGPDWLKDLHDVAAID
ncbi:hypothetical protein ACVIQS_000985 [Bradyrhizobium diazoefficiens]